jgi:hypothetical protein
VLRVRGRLSRSAAALALLVLTMTPQASAQGTAGGYCLGELDEDQVKRDPGPRLRFGITPLVQAGQIGGAPAEAVPERRARTHAALRRLRPSDDRPFVVRLNRFFWSDRGEGIRRYLALARRFTQRGYLVELQLRYHPDARQEGDIAAWTRYVRRVVRRFGPNPRVIALQVTNEVNITFSGDSSDGAFEGARQALVEGVVAAADEVREHDFDRLEIGFNWFYRLDPATERSFWTHVRERGGRRLTRSLDWIGLDAYPGTFFPPTVTPGGGERGAMVNAMSTLRCFARFAGIPDSVPMHVEENGWPTMPPVRSYERQAEFLAGSAGAVDDFRGTFNVTDYRWFNLRDGDTASPMLAQHYGLMESGYEEKPAFEAYASLVERRSHGRSSSRPR